MTKEFPKFEGLASGDRNAVAAFRALSLDARAYEAAAEPTAQKQTKKGIFGMFKEPVADHKINFRTRIGGLPVWPTDGTPLPVDARGNRMIFLAQVNLEGNNIPDFPQTGLLQFFVAADDVYGCDFPTYGGGKDDGKFRVCYWESLKFMDVVLDYYDDIEVMSEEETPLVVKDRMDLTTVMTRGDLFDMPPGRGTREREEATYAVPEEDTGSLVDYFEALPFETFHVGGHPSFTQEDIRGNRHYAEYDYVLLSMGSIEDVVVFGDDGIGAFFIRPEDLRKRDFTKVLWNWDCF